MEGTPKRVSEADERRDARRISPYPPCPNCGADLVGRSCKLRCPRCAYFESCSDLEPHP